MIIIKFTVSHIKEEEEEKEEGKRRIQDLLNKPGRMYMKPNP